jgi:hypothetical protein
MLVPVPVPVPVKTNFVPSPDGTGTTLPISNRSAFMCKFKEEVKELFEFISPGTDLADIFCSGNKLGSKNLTIKSKEEKADFD